MNLLFILPVDSETPNYVRGHITENTTWVVEDSPYIIKSDVIIDENITLTIQPGVVVKLEFFTRIIINGSLIAIGEEKNPIVFTSNQDSPSFGDWSSIKFNNNNNSISILNRCRIEYAIYGIWCYRSSINIVNNTIANIKSNGIYLQQSNSIIMNNLIENVKLTGIYCYESNPIIENNRIVNCTNYNIKMYECVSNISNNLLSYSVNGIYIEQSTSKIENNIISSTQYAIKCEQSNYISIMNNNIRENNYAIYFSESNFISINNTTIQNNNFGIYSRYSSVIISNSSILDSEIEDINLMIESNLTSVNTTFNGNKVLISNNCTLIVKNYLNFKVLDKNSFPLLNAEIQIIDNYNEIFYVKTKVSGLSNWILITDRIYFGSEEATENITKVKVSYKELPFEDNPRYVDMSETHTEIFKMKNIDPFINITSHSINTEVSNAVLLKGSTYDEDGYVETVEIRINNGYWEPGINYNTNWSTWGYQWNTTLYPNGEHIISARCKDNDGTYSTEISINLNVKNGENMPPFITLTFPAYNEIVSDIIIIIEGTATDEEPGFVKLVEVQIDKEAWVPTISTKENWSTWNYQWDTTLVSNGYHAIMVRAKDNFNIYSNTIFIRVYVYNGGNKPPEITINKPKDGEIVEGEISIEGSAWDLDGSIQELEIQVDNNPWENVTSLRGNWLEWICNLDTTGFANGEHTIKINAFDGLDITVESITIVVSNEGNMPPQIYITSHRDDDIVNNIVILKGIAYDTDDIVESVKIQIDNGMWQDAIETSPNWSTWCYNWDTLITSDGEHTINLRSFDGELYSAPHTIIVKVNNEEPPSSPTPITEDDEDEKDGGVILIFSDMIVWLLLLICVLLIIIILVLIWSIHRKKTIKKEEEEKDIIKEIVIEPKPIVKKKPKVKKEKKISEVKKKEPKKPQEKIEKRKLIKPPPKIITKELSKEAKKEVRKKNTKPQKPKKKGKKKIAKPPEKEKKEKSKGKKHKKTTKPKIEEKKKKLRPRKSRKKDIQEGTFRKSKETDSFLPVVKDNSVRRKIRK